MIIYDLQCKNGHTFEGWFEDGNAYEDQLERDLIACPMCHSVSVSKMPSTFCIKTSIKEKREAIPISSDSSCRPMEDPSAPHTKALENSVAHYIEKNFEDVGADFATKALKIHYGVEEPKNIRGVSTLQEEESLKKEGIEFFKFPVPTDSSDTEN